MMIHSVAGSSGYISPRVVGRQFLLALPFAAALAANFVITSVPDYRAAHVDIRIDSIFPRDSLRDRDNIVTGSEGVMHVRFRCNPQVPLRIGDAAALLVDDSGLHFSIAACADHEVRAAGRARWSAWAACSLLLFVLLSRGAGTRSA